MKKLLIATTNPGKLKEIKFFLSDLPLKLVSLKDCKISVKAKEDYPTFSENAKHKALFYCHISGLPTIADDGGLEIDALNGAPGVKSRRWVNGNDEPSDEQLIRYTLEKLKNVPGEKRGAQLRAVMALAFPNGKTYQATAKVRGVISEKAYKRTIKGYPYRSLFYIQRIGKFYHSREMTKEEIEKYNHRRKALEKLKEKLYKYLNITKAKLSY